MPNPKHVVIAGSSGLVGRALVRSFEADGVRVTRLVRRDAQHEDEVSWTPGKPLDVAVFSGVDAVVCLNGATTARLPWTTRYRQVMLRSRVDPARTIADAMRNLGDDAPHFVCASGISRYGSVTGTATELSPASSGFLGRLTLAWEHAATAGGTLPNTTSMRLAAVIDPDAALRPLIFTANLGIGGPLGAGTQSFPWVSLPDVVAAFRHVIAHAITGPVNVAGPNRAVMNDVGFETARELGKPYLLRMPAWLLRLMLRDAADELVLADLDAAPEVLRSTGFVWQHERAEEAVAYALSARG